MPAPSSAPTGRLAPWQFDPVACRTDLDAFEDLLAAKPELSERDDVLPFFRDHPHLSALLGSYNPNVTAYDRLGVEVGLFGQFAADVVAGDGQSRAIAHPERQDYPPYLATVETEGLVVAAAVMTPPRGPVLSRVAATEALPLLVDDLHRTYPAIPSVLGLASVSGTFVALWRRATGRPYRKGQTEHIYQLDTVTPVAGVPGVLRRATEADREFAVAWAVAFQREALGDDDARTAARMVDARLESGADSALYLWDDGGPVSLAGYTGPTPHGIRVGPVYTPPTHRGKGYASACVAALSQRLLDGGRAHCFLFTDVSNSTSNHIYQAIGYKLVCEVDEYRFL